MSNTPDLELAKDRLVDSLATARDATRTAVREDIGPAVVAAVGAAKDASGPVYADVAGRAADAVSALRGSDAVKKVQKSDALKKVQKSDAVAAIRSSDAVSKLRRKPTKSRGKRIKVLAAIGGLGAVAVAVIKGRSKSAQARPTYPAATAPPVPSDAHVPTPAEISPDIPPA